MENNLSNLLDKIYELEGLINLASVRKEIEKDLFRLIASKGTEISNLCSNLSEKEEKEKKTENLETFPEPDFILGEYSIDEDSQVSDDAETSFSDQNDIHDEKNLQKDIDVISEINEGQIEPLEEEISEYGEDKEKIYSEEPTPIKDLPTKEFTQEDKAELKRGKLVFSINDRFRFRRELFDNSDADFNNTLALVASMENYEEAEDYFLNEEGFDRDNKVVAEFLNHIQRYFA